MVKALSIIVGPATLRRAAVSAAGRFDRSRQRSKTSGSRRKSRHAKDAVQMTRVTDAVEKGFCSSDRVRLIQDHKQMRNLDPTTRLPDSFISNSNSTVRLRCLFRQASVKSVDLVTSVACRLNLHTGRTVPRSNATRRSRDMACRCAMLSEPEASVTLVSRLRRPRWARCDRCPSRTRKSDRCGWYALLHCVHRPTPDVLAPLEV